MTSSVGSLTVEEGLGLTGQSFSASIGIYKPWMIAVGLDSLSATFSVGTLIFLHMVMLTLVQIHLIVMFQQVRMTHIRMLQLDQIQVIVTLHRR